MAGKKRVDTKGRVRGQKTRLKVTGVYDGMRVTVEVEGPEYYAEWAVSELVGALEGKNARQRRRAARTKGGAT